MQHKKYLLLSHLVRTTFFTAILLNAFSLAFAAEWQPRIYDFALPKRVIAIDKNQQQFHIFEKHSPLTLKVTYPCTTGQVQGDKQVENDLRTPEGIYFIGYKIAKGLDFKEYGGVAYTLNYPNPVDRLRGKTGYGIWIHSKGEDADIVPLNTRGCIAIERKNIIEVAPLLGLGIPVVVGGSLNANQVPVQDTGVSRHLRLRMEQWTRAWASRSQKFFDFYDQASYTKAMPESFDAFRANKQRLFKLLAWINIFNREVHVLEGPGYWVTWSEQFYRAPNLSTEGIRRLYWQRDEGGQFRIVGMEWIPRNLGMQAAYEKGQLVAAVNNSASDALPLDAQTEVPVPPPLSMPEMGEDVKKDVQQVAAITSNANHKIVLTSEVTSAIQQNMDARATAWMNRDPQAFYAFYDSTNYGKVRATPSANFADVKKTMARFFKAPWVDMVSSKVQMHVRDDILLTIGNQLVYMPNKQVVQGEEHIYWQRHEDGEWRIVSSVWNEKKLGMEAAYLEKISSSVSKFIGQWRTHWLEANVDAYISHYASNARQGARGKTAIAAQKKDLWSKAAPAQVQLSGLRVQLDNRGVRADMTQVYKDKNGKGDKGTKTLLLEPYNGSWRIVQEDWTALQ